MTTPLTELADDRAKWATAAVAAFETKLAAAGGALAAARTAAAQAATQLETLRQLEKELRAKLGVAPLPADAEHLSDELEQTLVALLGAVASAAAGADALGVAQRDHARITAVLTEASLARSAAVDAAVTVHEEAARIAAWRAALAGQPVTDALAAAKTATGKEPYTKARDRLFGVVDAPLPAGKKPTNAHPFGQGMLDLLHARAEEAKARRADVEASCARVASRVGTTAAHAASQRKAVIARVRRLATGAVGDMAAVTVTCLEIAAGPLPTAAEQGSLDGLHNAALIVSPKQRAVFTAAQAWRDSTKAFDEKVLTEIAADPAFDPATSDAVKVEREAVGKATADLKTAGDKFAQAREDLDVWQVALPDQTKAHLVALFDVGDTLARLTAEPVAALLGALDAADRVLADALKAQDTREAVATRFARELGDRAGAVDAALATAGDRRAALIRGEG